MDAPITVAELDHSYGKGALRKQILFGINTEIPAGEIVIVTGPSGSGKTTLLTIVGALRSAQSGSVRVLGEELRDAKARRLESVRRQIGFIFQQHNLLGALTAQQNVELGLRMAPRMRGAALRRRAAGMLESVGMAEHRHKKPEQLSGGQRQRVAIARALGAEPRLLLADEPTGNLDPETSEQVFGALMGLVRDTGLAALVATHNPALAARMDRIVRLDTGRVTPG